MQQPRVDETDITMKSRKIYSTLRRRFCTAELRRLGFRHELSSGSGMVKRGGGRTLLATASSLDGQSWRVTPCVSQWR